MKSFAGCAKSLREYRNEGPPDYVTPVALPGVSDASRSHSLAGLAPDQERDRDFETCSGFPLRLVDANSSRSRSLMLYISFAAPLRLPGLVSPRLAASAAPAAFC